MTIDKFLELKDSLELQKYVRSLDFDKKKCCSFYGTPKKHPYVKKIEPFLLQIPLVDTPSTMNSILKISCLSKNNQVLQI